MLPPSKERPWKSREPPRGCQARPPRPSWQVLSQRNQCVSIWVESSPKESAESLAFVSACQVEELLRKQQQEKAASLQHFQDEVKRRVNHQVQLHRKQQLQRSCEAAEKESCMATQYSGSVVKKNTCLFRSHRAPIICSPGAGTSLTEQQKMQTEPLQQQATMLSKAMKQVRCRLAACRTLPQEAGPSRLPGGIWRQEVSVREDITASLGSLIQEDNMRLINPPSSDTALTQKCPRPNLDDVFTQHCTVPPKKPESCRTATVPTEDDSEELLLAGHHDLPAELQEQGPALSERDDFYIKIEFEKFCDRSGKDLSSSEPPQRPRTSYHTPLTLWTGIDQEETKKQHERQYLRYRRLFMNIEREQVKEQQRQKERQKRIAKIKSKKENERRVEEQRMQEMAEQQEPSLGAGACETLAQLKLEERRARKAQEKHQRKKEHVRYIAALRAQLKEKIKLLNIHLPPLCSCGPDFWDSHPDTCANNCIFYRNPTAYSHALCSLVSSCYAVARNPSVLLLLQDLTTLCAHWGKHL